MNTDSNDRIGKAFTLEPNDNRRLASLCGELNTHIHQMEERLQVEIRHRGNNFTVLGNPEHSKAATKVLQQLYKETSANT